MMMLRNPVTGESEGIQSPGPALRPEAAEPEPAIRAAPSRPRQDVSVDEADDPVRVVRKKRTADTEDRPEPSAAEASPRRPRKAGSSEEPDVRVQARRKSQEDIDVDEEDEDRDERPVKRVRRRKRKRAKKGAPLMYAWIPWAVGGVLVVGTVTAALVLKLVFGMGEMLLRQGISLAIMFPFSTVILLVSMVICTGGFDFGDPRTAILKVPAFLLVVNLVSMIMFPCGLILSFPLWLFGVMWLFDMDLWEAKMLFIINLVLNFLFKTFLLGVILTALMHGGKDKDLPKDEDDRMAFPGWTAEDIIDLGGRVECDANDPEKPVVGIVLQGTGITDDDLAHLRAFPQLRRLDLSNTRITDAGLLYLADMDQLQSLNLTGTRVTDRGARNLRRALPNLQVIR
jgi:hypothetical protein